MKLQARLVKNLVFLFAQGHYCRHKVPRFPEGMEERGTQSSVYQVLHKPCLFQEARSYIHTEALPAV